MEITKTDKFSRIALIIMFVIMLFFLLATGLSDYSVSKVPAFLMLVLLIVSLFSGKYNELSKAAITPIVISVIAYIFIYTISLFYSTTGQYSLTVFSYYLGGVSVFLLTVLLVNRNAVNIGLLLSILAFTVGIAGIFSIDAASIRALTPGLELALSSLLGYESITLGAFEAGTRMTSIINVPNIFSSLAALGTLASAYLFLSGGSKTEKRIYSGALIVNAVSLLYCFSLGSLSGMFFAVIGLIAFAGKERFRVVYVTLSTIIMAFLSVFIGSQGMGKSGAIAILPLISLLICGFLLAFILRYIDRFIAKAAALGGKKISVLLLVLVLLLFAFAGAALNLSGPYVYGAVDRTLRRSVSLEAGEYQVAINASDLTAVSNLLIESQSYAQASTHTSTTLYSGAIEQGTVAFAVPSDSNICFINITAADGTTIKEITILDLDGNSVKSVNPDYLLLPDFIANRLQGLLVNQNAAQRFVFFKDGLTIASMSPLIGHGPGAFESKILSVQNYYYVTNSAHNHYIQTLAETGIAGLASLLSIIVTCIAVLSRKVRNAQNRKLYAVLSAMLVMIIIHTAIEATFSYGIYNMAVFMIFGIISSKYGQKQSAAEEDKDIVIVPAAARNAAKGFCLFLLVIYIGQFASYTTINHAAASGDAEKFLDTLKTGTVLDFTNDISVKTAYLNSYRRDMKHSYDETAEKYARDVEKHSSFGSLTYLVDYYIEMGENEKAYQTLNNRQYLRPYDAAAWNQTFGFYWTKLNEADRASNPREEDKLVRTYAVAAYEKFKEFSAKSPLPPALSEENQEFAEIIAGE